jgi:hypothetical protein
MADGITGVSALSKNARQFQDLFDVIPFTLTFEDDSIADGAIYAGGGTVAVPGAAVGDFVLVAPEADAVDTTWVGNVTAADTVTVVLNNTSGGTVTAFASGVVVNGIVLSLKGPFKEIT